MNYAKHKTVSEMRTEAESILIGQKNVLDTILPTIQMFNVNLSPEDGPIGAFLLAGPTGTGKTHTAATLATILHGNRKHFLRIDCGEFQMDHEVAKLIGAPPGYLGHRETQPMLSQAKINSYSSEQSEISIVVFDEVEEAAASFKKLLLGILDRAKLNLGDNTTVNFEKCLILMTSNLGAREIQAALEPGFGFAGPAGVLATSDRVKTAATGAIKKHFSPEFFNRLTDVIHYSPLTDEDFRAILGRELDNIQQFIDIKFSMKSAELTFTREAKDFLLERGISKLYGARELKRTLKKYVLHMLADKLGDTGNMKAAGGDRLEIFVSGDSLDARGLEETKKIKTAGK